MLGILRDTFFREILTGHAKPSKNSEPHGDECSLIMIDGLINKRGLNFHD